jgi:hypothetical protein
LHLHLVFPSFQKFLLPVLKQYLPAGFCIFIHSCNFANFKVGVIENLLPHIFFIINSSIALLFHLFTSAIHTSIGSFSFLFPLQNLQLAEGVNATVGGASIKNIASIFWPCIACI